jgi:hypothetical protein
MNFLALPPPSAVESGRHQQFLSMLKVFQKTGGLRTGDEVAQRLAICSDQPISMIARWIVDRIVVSFQWKSHTLVPLFQFDPVSMSLRNDVADIVRELTLVLDDWETALWFSEPNGWLYGATPAGLVLRDQAAVFKAAQADLAFRRELVSGAVHADLLNVAGRAASS